MSEEVRMDPNLTAHRWLMLRVVSAESLEELDEILIDIECDKFEGEPWTLDSVRVNQLRYRFVEKRKSLRSELP